MFHLHIQSYSYHSLKLIWKDASRDNLCWQEQTLPGSLILNGTEHSYKLAPTHFAVDSFSVSASFPHTWQHLSKSHVPHCAYCQSSRVELTRLLIDCRLIFTAGMREQQACIWHMSAMSASTSPTFSRMESYFYLWGSDINMYKNYTTVDPKQLAFFKLGSLQLEFATSRAGRERIHDFSFCFEPIVELQRWRYMTRSMQRDWLRTKERQTLNDLAS